MNGTSAYSSAVYSAYEVPECSKGDPVSYELDQDIFGKLLVDPSSIPRLPRPWVALTGHDSMRFATWLASVNTLS